LSLVKAGAPTAPGERPRRRSHFAVLIAATLLALGLAEVGLRIFSPQLAQLRKLVELTDDERGFAPKPSTRVDFGGVFEPLARPIVWQTNAAGFRDDHEVGPPGERFRIATYGDSETFGWSVALEETFQRRMEAIDPRVEVLNFGVPGYQVINVRKQLERTVPPFQPDLAIYLVHKNDFNEPPQLTRLSSSHLLLHVHFLWHFTIGKEIRLAIRDRPEHLQMFADEVDRMTRALEARDIPFVLAFLRWKNHAVVREYVVRGTPRLFRRQFVDVESVLGGEIKIDDHYGASAHRKLASLLCRVISESDEGSCLPPGWSRGGVLQASLPR
jgi:hypothetical protein